MAWRASSISTLTPTDMFALRKIGVLVLAASSAVSSSLERPVEQMTQGRPLSAPYCAAATAPAGEEKSMMTPLQGSASNPA